MTLSSRFPVLCQSSCGSPLRCLLASPFLRAMGCGGRSGEDLEVSGFQPCRVRAEGGMIRQRENGACVTAREGSVSKPETVEHSAKI